MDSTFQPNNQSTSGVYGLLCVPTGKWYVGETKNDIQSRWKDYARLGCKEQPKLYNAILKHGWENFSLNVLEVLPPDKKLLQEREVYWISKLNSFRGGYNCNIGGYSNCGKALAGKPKTEAHRKKLSEANRGQGIGRKLSERTKMLISVAKMGDKHPLYGTHCSEETKQKMSIAHKGKIRSKEHCEALSKAKKLYWEHKKNNQQAALNE